METMTQDSAATKTSRPTAPQDVCEQCGEVFTPRVLNGPNASRFCSDGCRQEFHRQNKAEALAVVGTRRKMREMADGTLRVEIDIDPSYRPRFLSQFQEIDVPVGLIRLNIDPAGKVKPKPASKPFGEQAKALKLSGFLRTPDVWRTLGTDEEFRAWVQKQPSAWSGEFSEYVNGEGRSIAAHVRRAGESGTAYKAEYACIPLTNAEHQRQHQHGESVFDSNVKGEIETGREWMDRMRIKYVEMWAWDRLRQELQVESMGDADPKWILAWAQRNGLERYLPAVIREA